MARILGVDPGLTRCGWAIIESGKLLDSGLFQSSPADPPHTRVGAISAELEQIAVSHKPSLIALERVFAQANLRSVMGVAQVSGALMACAHRLSIGVEFFTPSEVKAAVTGNGRATKDQVKLMVSKMLGLRLPKLQTLRTQWRSPSPHQSAQPSLRPRLNESGSQRLKPPSRD